MGGGAKRQLEGENRRSKRKESFYTFWFSRTIESGDVVSVVWKVCKMEQRYEEGRKMMRTVKREAEVSASSYRERMEEDENA